jgi:hypothetical protein
VILGILSRIDLSLTGNLVLIVIFSGYENFVSRGRARGCAGRIHEGAGKEDPPRQTLTAPATKFALKH